MPNQVKTNPELPDITESDRLWQRAQGLIPAGTQTLAKGPSQFSNGVAPKYLVRGRGARVWDVDGNEFLDYNMGVGPIILGYCHPVVDEAIARCDAVIDELWPELKNHIVRKEPYGAKQISSMSRDVAVPGCGG